jgi:ubiquinone/menaquinone biosynthesis C-methylase UbiE
MLEVAPGPARLSAELRQVPVAVGMDFSPRMLAEARRRTRARGLAWNLVRGDGFKLPFARASFDWCSASASCAAGSRRSAG